MVELERTESEKVIPDDHLEPMKLETNLESKYKKWVQSNVSKDCLNQCEGISLKMSQDFPELMRVRGFYYDIIWGIQEHWWCETSAGEIVDPTASQFPTRGKGGYRSVKSTAPEPSGKCIDCGNYVYDGKTFCNDSCQDSWAVYHDIIVK